MSLNLVQLPVGGDNHHSESPLVLVCEHAGNLIPDSLENLGVSQRVIDDHYGWDIGALGVARGIAETLHAELVYQRYSRLVVDCNRPLDNPELIPEVTETVVVPGNQQLSDIHRSERIEGIWRPFQDGIACALERRMSVAGFAVLVAVHSFSPVFHGVNRPWHVCLAYNRDNRLAKMLFNELESTLPDFSVAMNQPFRVSDHEDQTIPAFGEAAGIPHVLLEIRNDLLRSRQSQKLWAERIATALAPCLEQLRS